MEEGPLPVWTATLPVHPHCLAVKEDTDGSVGLLGPRDGDVVVFFEGPEARRASHSV